MPRAYPRLTCPPFLLGFRHFFLFILIRSNIFCLFIVVVGIEPRSLQMLDNVLRVSIISVFPPISLCYIASISQQVVHIFR